MIHKIVKCYFPSKCLDAQQAHHYAPNFFFLLSFSDGYFGYWGSSQLRGLPH